MNDEVWAVTAVAVSTGATCEEDDCVMSSYSEIVNAMY